MTGGASGIGLAILQGLHREGAKVVCADINTEALSAVEREFGERVVCTAADVTKESDVERMVELAVALGLAPKVLLLDEPAAGVPSGESGVIIDIIESLPPDIALLINTNLIRAAQGRPNTGSLLTNAFPNHWVVLVSEIILDETNRRVFLPIWTWGGVLQSFFEGQSRNMLVVPLQAFIDNYYGSVVTRFEAS